MPSVTTRTINPAFDFKMTNLNINFIGLSVSNPDIRFNTSIKDTLYILNKNTKSVLFTDLVFKDAVLRNRNLSANDKNLVTTMTSLTRQGDYVSIDYTFSFKGANIGVLNVKYPYSYYTRENSLLLPFQSFPIDAVYRVIDPGVLIKQYYGQSITEPDRKTGILDMNFIVSCQSKEGISINEDVTISVNLMNGGFVRPPGGGAIITDGGSSGGSSGGSGGTGTRTTAWRASTASASCVNSVLNPTDIYLKLEFDNEQTTDNYTPDSTNWSNHIYTTTRDMYVSFWSDQSCTVPLTLTNQSFTLYVTETSDETTWSSVDGSSYSSSTTYRQDVQPYTLANVSGHRILLVGSKIITANSDDNLAYNSDFATVPNVQPITASSYTFDIFPDNKLKGGPTGYKGWSVIEEYYTDNGTATGQTRLNVPSDPNYVAPVMDTASCPIVLPVINISLGAEIVVNSMNFVNGANTDAANFPNLPYSSGPGSNIVAYKRSGSTSIVVNVTHTGGDGTVPGYIRMRVYDNGVENLINVPKGVTTTLGPFNNITTVNPSKW